MAFTRAYLDSNFFIYAFEGDPGAGLTKTLLRLVDLTLSATEPFFVTSQLTLAEVLVHPIRNGDAHLEGLYRSAIAASSPWLRVPPVDTAVLEDAAKLRAQNGLKLPDAIHGATARLNQCSHVLTSDGDFKSLTRSTSAGYPIPVKLTEDDLQPLLSWLEL